MRTEHWRQGDAERTRRGVSRAIVTIVGGLVLIGLAVSGFARSSGAGESLRAAEDEAAQIDLLQARVELGWLHFDLITDSLAGKIANRPIDATFADFGENRDLVLDDVRRLAARGGDVAPLADSVLDIHADADVGRWPVDASRLDMLHYDSMPFDRAAGTVVDRIDAHLDAVSVSMLPRLVLGDALALAMQRQDDPTPRWAAEYVDQTASIATDDPGWLGPARQSPVTNHVLSDSTDTDGVYRSISAVADAVESMEPALQRVWDYDQWIIAGDLDSDAPFTIDELAADVDEISEAFEEGFRAGLAEERAAIVDAAPSQTTATIWFVAAIASLVVLTLGLFGVMVRLWRRQRSLNRELYVDGLTGAFNRKFLDEEVDGWCHRRSGHVAVAMVDLDRFKLVNDTWGHAAGDAVLTETARRLAVAAAGVRPDTVDATSAVVRVGGDEFLVAWFGSVDFDVDAIDRAIRRVAGVVEMASGESVPLELSIGVATSSTPTHLDDLMRAADLGVYRDKDAKRASAPLAEKPAIERA